MVQAIQVPTLASETIVHIGSFELRNTMLMAWIAMAVLVGIGLLLRGAGCRLVPGRFQAFLEIIVEGLYDFFGSIFGDERLSRRFFPMLATMFLFILTANWMGIFPGVGSILVQGEHEGQPLMIPLLRSMNADVNMTLTFALVAGVLAQVMGVLSLGIIPHAKKYIVAPWTKPYGIGTVVGLLELVSEVTRVVSFTFRLFGNIFAGEVLLVVVTFLLPYLVPVPFLVLEVFVGFIQALVFAMLTCVFLAMAMTIHGDHDKPHAPHAARV